AGAGCCGWATSGMASAAIASRTSKRFIEVPPKHSDDAVRNRVTARAHSGGLKRTENCANLGAAPVCGNLQRIVCIAHMYSYMSTATRTVQCDCWKRGASLSLPSVERRARAVTAQFPVL